MLIMIIAAITTVVAIIIMAFEIEISNVESLVKDHQAEQFHNFMETKVAELDQQEEHMSYML